MTRNVNWYRVLFQLAGLVLLCYITRQVLYFDNVLLSLFVPGVGWGLLWYISNFYQVKEKTYTGFIFLTASLVLWPVVLLLSVSIGMVLMAISTSLSFILIGGVAAFFSCYIFSSLVLNEYLRWHGLLSFLLGMIAFPLTKIFDTSADPFLSYATAWQLCAGAGLVYIGIKTGKPLIPIKG